MIHPHMAVRSLQALSVNAPRQSASSAVQCPVVLDGRIPQNFTLDASTPTPAPTTRASPRARAQSPRSCSSRRSRPPRASTPRPIMPASFKPVEITVNDNSIFDPSGNNPQLGFRRAGLLLGTGSDASNQGVMTFHWSSIQGSARKLNLTHEYLTAFHETNDSGGAQFALQLGLSLGQNGTEAPASNWKMLDRKNAVVFTAPLKFDAWQSFAVTLDAPKNTMQVFFSEGNAPLKAVTEVLPNDNTGGGALQIGMLKKPTETKTAVFDGFQESNLNEGQILGGILVKNSASGCVSLPSSRESTTHYDGECLQRH